VFLCWGEGDGGPDWGYTWMRRTDIHQQIKQETALTNHGNLLITHRAFLEIFPVNIYCSA